MINKLHSSLKAMLSNITIKNIFTIFIVMFSSIVFCAFITTTYKTIYSSIFNEKIEKLSYITDFTLEILKDEAHYANTGKSTLEAAQTRAINVLKDVRFEQNDYIWIAKYDGYTLYHPVKNLIGTNLANHVDVHGYNFGKKLLEISKTSKKGYVTYSWIKVTTQKQTDKITYIKCFDEWGWIIGTGIYIDEIKTKVLSILLKGAISIFVVTLFIFLIFKYILWTAIVNPIQDLAEKSLRLSNNDLSITLPILNKKTELGQLYYAFNKFVDFFQEKQQNEKRLSLIYNNINDALITCDENGIIVATNPTVKSMFGYNQKELLGKSINLLTSPVIFKEQLNINSRITGKYELLGIMKNERFFSLDVTINDFIDNDKLYYLLLLRDITKQKEIDKMKNEFISTVSHELRTPLTSIKGSLGLLLSGIFPAIEGKAKELIDIANNNTLRLINLINDILDIEKIAAGKLEFHFENINIEKIIIDTIESNKPYGDKFKVEYNFVNKSGENCIAKIDSDRFAQVLTNLLSNAAKFSPEKSAVSIILEKIDNIAKITVSNKGKGIALEFQDKIFEKFTQGDSSDARQKGGTGLGLSICKKLVEKMNGKIYFESELNKGTSFYLEFPCQSDI